MHRFRRRSLPRGQEGRLRAALDPVLLVRGAARVAREQLAVFFRTETRTKKDDKPADPTPPASADG